MSASKISAKLAALPKVEAELTAKLEAAKARETLVVGQKYPIYQGKGETRTVVEATLLKQRTNAEGGTEFLFEVDGEFEPVRCTARALAIDSQVGEDGKKLPSSAAIAKRLAALGDVKEKLEVDLEEALQREQLVVNEVYSIRVGRGTNAEVVLARLLGEGIVEKQRTKKAEDGTETIVTSEKKMLNFFYGAGFEARTVLVTSDAVVLSTAEEDAAAAAEADADGAVTEADEAAE